MALTRYGQIVGNMCTGVITFDPARTPVEQMEGSLSAKLLPINDYLAGAWGIGATWDGISIVQDGTAGMDAPTVTSKVTDLQAQVDFLTTAAAQQASAPTTLAGSVTTGTNGLVNITWSQVFSVAPTVVVTARNTQTYGVFGEVTAVTTTGATVRAWRMQNTSTVVAGNNIPAVTLSGAILNVMAVGVLA